MTEAGKHDRGARAQAKPLKSGVGPHPHRLPPPYPHDRAGLHIVKTIVAHREDQGSPDQQRLGALRPATCCGIRPAAGRSGVSQPAAGRGSGRIKCGIGTGNREMPLHAPGGEVACHDRHAAREGGFGAISAERPRAAYRCTRSWSPGVYRDASSSEPLPEDVQQRRCGLLVQSQHAAVRYMRVQHDDPVFLGH